MCLTYDHLQYEYTANGKLRGHTQYKHKEKLQ